MSDVLKCIIFMMFMHVVDDYYLQGILASMKQKSWWTNQPNYDKMYRYDYIVALLMHSFSWTFMIMLPALIIFNLSYSMLFTVIVFFVNMIVHCIVDDLKANRKRINLLMDQLIHISQITITATICSIFVMFS